jgi:hypothetical protein
MTRRLDSECKCSSTEGNGLIQIRQDTMLFKSDLKSAGKVIERYGSTRMTRGTECKGISMEIDCLIQVR